MRRREILCIDDDEQSLQVRKILLETFDFRVTTARSAREGLRYFRAHHVDAVVLDYEMPEMNGGQVARKMKSLRANVPIMILSALPWLPKDAPRECLASFVTKGGPTPALVEQIEQMMEQAPVPAPRGRSMRLVGAMSGVVVEKVRAMLGRPKPSGKPLAHAPARTN